MSARGVIFAFIFVCLLLTSCDALPFLDRQSATESSLLSDLAQSSTSSDTPSLSIDLPDPPRAATATPAPVTEIPEPSIPPRVVEYDLGEALITQPGYTADDPLHQMPVRLQGLIGVPTTDGPHPIALILHGDHLSCPPDPESGEAVWPCDAAHEQRNYRGFEYLVRELAAGGTVALSINANAEYSAGFGEALPGTRLRQIIDLHLHELISASAGGENKFGTEVYGRIDAGRLVWIAHSEAGELANDLIRTRGLADPINAAFAGYGPLHGLILIAPTLNHDGSQLPAGVPLGLLLPACDGITPDLIGQAYYEAARGDLQRDYWALSTLLDAAEHNQFNEVIPPDLFAADTRPQCRLAKLLPAADQRTFLAAFSTNFMTTLFAEPAQSRAAAAALGIDTTSYVPSQPLGFSARSAFLPPAADERLLLRPFSAAELEANLRGGAVAAEKTQLLYCPAEESMHAAFAALQPCHRLRANHPGDPTQILAAWEQPHAVLRFSLPPDGLDLRDYSSIQLRVVLDPLSTLNTTLQQSLGITLTDATGNSDRLSAPAMSPALTMPPGDIDDDHFSGHVQLSDLRLPLADFSQVDLSEISEISLNFDQSDSGALFIADLAFIQARRYPGVNSTLLNNDGSLDKLRSIGRFHGASTCSAALIDTGAPRAPAVVITSGHCAQQWSSTDIFTDIPAGDMRVVFNYFANTKPVQIAVPATRVLYSTMKGQDVALVELAETQAALAARDITPFTLAAATPPDLREVTVIGAPATGLPAAETYLRREHCSADGRASVIEFEWQFNDAYRINCQDIYGGSSGSPVFAADSQQIIGLVTTTTIGGQTPCYLGVPCEITATGPVMKPRTSYATPVDGIGACFTAAGRFDLALPACPLDGGRQLTISGTPPVPVQPVKTLPDGSVVPNTWNASLSGDLPYYRAKIGPVGRTDCRREEGYGEVRLLAKQPLIDEPLPREDGYYNLCLLAGPGPEFDQEWQSPRHATVARVQIDTTPPVAAPVVNIDMGENDILITPQAAPPELAAFLVKSGPLATTDCAISDGYTNIGSGSFTVPTANLPAILCVIGLDSAANPGPPARHILDS